MDRDVPADQVDLVVRVLPVEEVEGHDPDLESPPFGEGPHVEEDLTPR